MASALALGHNGPRLRSRRLRSDRSHRLSLGFVLTVIAFASLVWFEGGNLIRGQLDDASPVDAAAAEQQRFVIDLRPIHAEVQQSVEQEGLLVAAYEGGEIDRVELQRRLAAVLASYRNEQGQLEALSVSPAQVGIQQTYLDALRALDTAAGDLSRAYDDGDQRRAAAALGLTLQAMAHLHTAAELSAPARG